MSDKDDDSKKANRDILKELTEREIEVLKMQLGINVGSKHTLEEVTKQFDVVY